MTDRGYADPVALRQAITDRLRQLAQERPGAQPPRGRDDVSQCDA